jgi:hypothetical protein
MKSFIASALMLISLNVFSQSYVVLSNGITLTTDKAGFIYDFGHFHLPYKINVRGHNFFIEEKKLSTIDVNGFLYEKSGIKANKLANIKGFGGNFFINDDNHLFTIDARGFFFQYDKDDKIFKKVVSYGGNYFLVKPEDKKPAVDLYTVNDKGNYLKMNIPGLNPADITALEGNYFLTKTGVIYTVSKDGFVFSKADMPIGPITKAGGNYLISNGLIYTVSEDGLFILPVLPLNFKIFDLKTFGANYMIDSEGRIFIVDKAGNIAERSSTHDLRNAKINSL